MIDHIEDRLVRDAFDQFNAEVTAEVPGPDLTGVRRIAHRRRNARVVLSAAVMAIAVAVPLTVYVLAARYGRPSVTSPPPRPPVTRDDVMKATLVIPQWGAVAERRLDTWETDDPTRCPTGLVQMAGLLPPSDWLSPVYIAGERSDDFLSIDVDRDGDLDAVVVLSCHTLAGGFRSQVIAVERDDAGGLQTFGQILRAANLEPVKTIAAVRAEPGGNVGVRVTDMSGYGGEESERQWRTYRFDGAAFRQVGGPREFAPTAPPTDLAVTMTPLRLDPAPGGGSRATTTATVTNRGPAPAHGLILIVGVDQIVTGQGPSRERLDVALPGATSCTALQDRPPGSGPVLVCKSSALEPGASRTIEIEVTSPMPNDDFRTGADLVATVTVRAELPGVRTIPDTNQYDNWTKVTTSQS